MIQVDGLTCNWLVTENPALGEELGNILDA